MIFHLLLSNFHFIRFSDFPANRIYFHTIFNSPFHSVMRHLENNESQCDKKNVHTITRRSTEAPNETELNWNWIAKISRIFFNIFWHCKIAHVKYMFSRLKYWIIHIFFLFWFHEQRKPKWKLIFTRSFSFIFFCKFIARLSF